MVAYVWFNHGSTLRKAGSKTDVYEAFKRPLARGVIADDIDTSLREAAERRWLGRCLSAFAWTR